MRPFSRTFVLVATLAASVTISPRDALAQESRKEPSGSISGTVMLGDRPVPRAVVLLTSSNSGFSPNRPLPLRATTDEEGRYRFTAVQAGTYNLGPSTPAFVLPTETPFGQPGKSVTLAEGEQVDGMDFSLTRGAVITGRVTDSEGRPVIDQRVNIMLIDERGRRLNAAFNPFMFSTDDRGIYRLYGLPAGRYKVSVGDAPDSGMVRIGFGGGVYTRTFHPGVTDEARATIIEVKAGGEVADIDIQLGGASKTYVATGRTVDADTGKPLANLQYGHGAVTGQQPTISSYGWTNNRSNSNGEFRIEGLSPGRFAAFVIATEQVDFYSEPAVFEVIDSDVSGLEIKVRRGASVSGVAVVEGVNDADAKTPKLELRASVRSEGLSAPIMAPVPLNPDGNFRITGLRPGKLHIFLGGFPPPKGFTLVRVERGGVVQREGIDVAAGETITGVRLLIEYGTGVVRGEVKTQGGQLTPEMRLRVVARRLDADASVTASAGVDARGRFSLEGLLPGEYEVAVNLMLVSPSSPSAPSVVRGIPKSMGKQNVTVSNGTETNVILVIDLSDKDKEGDK